MGNKNEKKHLFFSDGSSLGNPGPGGWGAVVVIGEQYVAELGGSVKHTTNNKMELTGAIEGLTRLKDEIGPVDAYLDSQYVIQGVTKWRAGWEKRGWMTLAKEPVENKSLWVRLFALVDARRDMGDIKWNYVPGHLGVEGNERVDVIATTYALGEEPGLFEGELGDYAVDVLNIRIDETKVAARSVSRVRERAKAYCYLSMVDGKILRHTTWGECEKRVRGKSGAKYRKAISPEDEQEIRKNWGEK